MTTHTRTSTTELRPIGRGTLHTAPTDLKARRESLREWARCSSVDAQRPEPASADATLAKPVTEPIL